MTSQSRTVRVFLSSTFRDFAEERDLLVRKVFPELRRKCRERQVELVDVDLRWGITEKEAQQGKVLPICLAEIDRSRPYFMGFIGERYGWVPEKHQYDLSLIIEQPWLDEHRGGKSVTELEMLHGVLNNPKMAGRAFFYFRSPAYSRKKGGPYLSEGTEEKAKLETLKVRIRKSGFPAVENYRSPEDLAERVRDDLWKLIDESFPESETPDPLTRERTRHEAYSTTRQRLYLGGERYFEALDSAMKAKAFRPVLVSGQSGGGKSALLANWVARWSRKHPKTAVIVHHLGSGSDAADPVRLAVRMMREISRLTGDELKLESDPEKQLEQLPQWLALASAWAQRSKKELLIVLDGLDKVSDRKHLRWFPGFLPPKVKLLASCLQGDILEAAKGRLDWRELKVKPFTKAEQKSFIGEYLGRYRKALTAKQMKMLQGHPLSGNPLFLLTVLEELRVFGVHEELEQRMRTLLSPPPSKGEDEASTVDDVFEHVLARIEKDLGKKAVQQAMEALWASRAGLYQDELLAIAKLAPAKWAAIQNALDESIYESSGKITFGHDYLRKAVEDRHGLTGKRKLKLHRLLAQWFDDHACNEGVDQRMAEELPWQWYQCGSKPKLEEAILDAAVFEALHQYDQLELRKYWLFLKKDPVRAYQKAWKEWQRDAEKKSELLGVAFRLAEFLREGGSPSKFVSELYHYSKDYVAEVLQRENEHYEGEASTAIDNSRGLLLLSQARYKEAEKLFRKVLIHLEAVVGKEHPDALDTANNLARCLWHQNKLPDAERLCNEALTARLKLFGENHERTVSSLIMSGNIAAGLGRREEALAFHKRSISAAAIVSGENAEMTLGAMLNCASVLREMNSFAKAELLCRKAIAGFTSEMGPRHPVTLTAESTLAKCLWASGKKTEADKMLTKVLLNRERVLGGDHPQTLASLHDLGVMRVEKGNLQSGESLQRKALRERVRTLGVANPDSLRSVNQLGKLMETTGNHVAQEKVFSDYLKKIDCALGPADELALQNVIYLAYLKNRHGSRSQALGLLRKRAALSPLALDAVRYNLACYECLTGNTEEAKRLIAEHVRLHPETKDQAQADPDFESIRDFIATL